MTLNARRRRRSHRRHHHHHRYIFVVLNRCVYVHAEVFKHLGSTAWHEQRLLPRRLRYVQ